VAGMRSLSRHWPLIALVVASAPAEPGLALALAPALLLLALLARGIHPGEALIERLRVVRPARRRPAAVLWPRLELVVRPAWWFAPALAVRPPPRVV
jgi:hypothetical protein